jgi:hypothetical protein
MSPREGAEAVLMRGLPQARILRAGAGLDHHEGLRPRVVVGHRQVDHGLVARRGHRGKARGGAPVQRQCRRARRCVDDADVLHEHALGKAGAQRLGAGLLGGEPLGQRARAGERAGLCAVLFGRGEHALDKAFAIAFERVGDALDIAQVGTEADDHGTGISLIGKRKID